jgi:UDPglucose 6-dehydrogenase
VDVITGALGLDSRIGSKYLKGALGYGGPCFPRDNVALSAFARQWGAHAVLAEATHDFNRAQVAELADALLKRLPEKGCVGILGLSYKPGTDVIEESPGMAFAQHFLARGTPVVVYDPAALPGARSHLKGDVAFAESAAACARQADILMITTPWDEFRSLSPDCLDGSRGRPIIVDCWRILRPETFGGRAELVALGKGPGHDYALVSRTTGEER